MNINIKDIEGKLNEIEDKFFSEPFYISGIQVWPLFKDFFYYKQLEIIVNQKHKNDTQLYSFPKLYPLRKHYWNLIFRFLKFNIKNQVVLKMRKSQFLFFDVMNKEYFDKSQNKVFSRYLTPYYEEISKIGSTSMIKISLEEEEHILKMNDSFEPKHILKAKKYYMLSRIASMHSYKYEIEVILKKIDDFLIGNNVSDFKYSAYSNTLSIKILEIQFYQQIAEQVINSVQPKAIFFETFFGHPDYYGATLAAKKSNVISVDIQHGTASAFMYRGCRYESNNTNCLLPDYYWTWSQMECDYVKSQRLSQNVLLPIHLGKHVISSEIKGVQEFDIFINEIKKIYKKIIVISFQYNYREYEFLKEIIIDLKDCFFLLRYHPMDFKDIGFREYHINYFSGLKNIEHELSSLVDLDSIFKVVDLHMTLHSATAIEALNLGIRTILFDREFATSNYELYCKAGVFLTFDSINDLKHKITNVKRLTSEECKYYNQYVSSEEVSKRINMLLINNKR